MANESKFRSIFDNREKSEELQKSSNETPPSGKDPSQKKKVGRPAGKRSDKRYRQITLLMKKETIAQLKASLLKQENEKKDLSDLIDEACQQWLKKS